MGELKTKATGQSVEAFLAGIEDLDRRKECETLLKLMKQATREKPAVWGNGVVGFGSYHYKYPSGQEGDWFLAGFSARKNDLSIHLVAGLDYFKPLLKKLGKHKAGRGCLYVKRLSDIDLDVLKELVQGSVARTKEIHAAAVRAAKSGG